MIKMTSLIPEFTSLRSAYMPGLKCIFHEKNPEFTCSLRWVIFPFLGFVQVGCSMHKSFFVTDGKSSQYYRCHKTFFLFEHSYSLTIMKIVIQLYKSILLI